MKIQKITIGQQKYNVRTNDKLSEKHFNINGERSTMPLKKVPLNPVMFGVKTIKPKNNAFIHISFGSAANKKSYQIVSIPSEREGVLNGLYKEGGLACVAKEAPESWLNNEQTPGTNLDVRTILPYHSLSDNVNDEKNKGVLVLKTDVKGVNLTKKTLDSKINKNVISEALRREDVNYKPTENEILVIADSGNFREIERLEKYSGKIKSVTQDMQLQEVPYQLFRLKQTEAEKKKRGEIYFMHTPQMAQLPKAYGGSQCSHSGSGGWDGETKAHFLDHDYADFSRAVVDVLPKLSKEGFEPANIWIHDRMGMAAITDMANKAEKNDYFEGLRVHSTFHNTGGAYQGKYQNPIDYFSILADEQDYEELEKSNDGKNIKFIKYAIEQMKILAKKQYPNPYMALDEDVRQGIEDIFSPYLEGFKDDNGNYNMAAIALHAAETQNDVFSAGTVSRNYGKESSNPDTPEMSEGLQKRYKAAENYLINITNGSAAASMATDADNINNGTGTRMGLAGSGFDNEMLTVRENGKVVSGYVPYKYDEKTDNIDEIFQARLENKRQFYNTIVKHSDDLAKLFLNPVRIQKEGDCVLGKFEKKDLGGKEPILMVGWGRGDSQKGFPVSLEGFKQFLKDSSIDEVDKKRVNILLVGAGLHKDESEWGLVKKQMEEINAIDGGKYKNQAIFVDGFCSGKYASCADFAYLSSRFEPCGITPIESKICGAPVLSTNTGGAPDLIQEGVTGFLTQDAYLIGNKTTLLPQDKQNLTGDELRKAIDKERMLRQGKQLAGLLKKALFTYNDEDKYKAMTKSCLIDRSDWYNNASANGGLSANQLYFQKIWQIDQNNQFKPLKGRTTRRINKLLGKKLGNLKEDTYKKHILNEPSKPISKKGWIPWAIAGGVTLAGAAAGGVYYYVKHNNNKQELQNTQDDYYSINDDDSLIDES